MATERQIRAAATALMMIAAGRQGVIVPDDILDRVEEDFRNETLEDARIALEAAEKVRTIILPGELNG